MHHVVGIRWKVLTVLGLPVLVLALAAGAVSLTAVQDARHTRAVGAFATAQDGALRVQAALQAERLASLVDPSAASDASGASDAAAPSEPAVPPVAQRLDVTAARSATDREIAAFDLALAATRLTEAVPEATSALSAAQTAHERLAALRRTVDGGLDQPGVRDAVAAGYAAAIATDVALPGAVGEELDDRDLGRRLAAGTLIAGAGEAAARAYLLGVASTTPDQRALGLTLADLTRALDGYRAQVGLSTPAEVTELATAATAFQTLAERLGDPTASADRQQWDATYERLTTAVRAVARRVAADAALSAERLAVDAEKRAALVAGAAVAVVGLTVLLALMQSRRITQPLRGLASAATRSRERLPEVVDAVVARRPDVELPPIEVTTRDEIGAVASAFRDVQATVVDIAQQQAALRVVLAETFVNVARRNQVLLGRQLALIDRLERTEEDPGALENLFRLDHLATRMRRNAESLLVLAGIDSGRQLRQAMPASDVVRTAISEIEQFERVQVYAESDPAVLAHHALPLAHLLAELVENATQFSDPATTVLVHVGGLGDRVQVTVRDNGLGMSLDDLTAANARLEAYADHAPVGAEAIGSERLGLFVVARLAAKLGAVVRLHSRSGGTEAVVELPPALFVSVPPVADADDPAPLPAPPPLPTPVLLPTLEPVAAPEPALLGEPLWEPEPVAPQPLPHRRPHAEQLPPPLPEPTPEPLPEPFSEPFSAPSAEPWPTPLPEPIAAPAPEPAAASEPVPRGMIDVLPRQQPRSHFGLRGRRQRRSVEHEPFFGTGESVDSTPTTARPEPTLARRNLSQGHPRSESESESGSGTDAALRSALASQALTELSLLASYRPTSEAPSAATLARRAPAPPPPEEPIPQPVAPQQVLLDAAEGAGDTAREPRTPDGVRSTLSAFAAGAARGRVSAG